VVRIVRDHGAKALLGEVAEQEPDPALPNDGFRDSGSDSGKWGSP